MKLKDVGEVTKDAALATAAVVAITVLVAAGSIAVGVVLTVADEAGKAIGRMFFSKKKNTNNNSAP